MSVKVTSNTPKLMADARIKAGLAIRYALDDIDKIAGPKTPKKLGNLRRDTLKQVLGLHGTIIWQKEYAIYQEKKKFGKYTTPGTGPNFAENAVKKVVVKSAEYFKKANLI